MFRGEHYFLSYSGIEKVQLMEIRRTLEEAEAMMQIKFTYEQIELLPYLLSVMFLRIRDRRLIDTAFHIDEKSLSDTREYHITDILLEKLAQFQNKSDFSSHYNFLQQTFFPAKF